MAVTIKDNSKRFQAWIERRQDAYLTAITRECHTLARKAASVPNPGQPKRFSKELRARRRAQKKAALAAGEKFALSTTQRTVYPFPSKPDESPRMRTTKGHKNIVQGYSRARKEGRVGYTRLARYMAFHELGIRYRRMGFQQRPTIMPVVRGQQPRLLAVGKAAIRRTR